MKFTDFTLLSWSRPVKISLEEASRVFGEAVCSGLTEKGRRQYLQRRWETLSLKLTEEEQLWIFETGGTVTAPKRGIAREQRGRVTDFVIF